LTTDDVLLVENLTRRYGRKRALDDVSFGVRRGEIFGFLGPNGAGKTTAIRIALGLIRATSGRVFLFGEPRRGAALSAMARIGAVVEAPRFYTRLSGRENLYLLAALSGTPRSRIDEVLTTVRLTEAAGEAVGGYSMGMRQRLGIAQALLAEPEFIILDEPANGLDPHGVREMRQLVTDLNRERGITFLISSHQLSEVEEIAHRVAILRKGRLVATGEVGEILTRKRAVQRIRVADPDAARAVLPDAEVGPDGVLRVPAAATDVPHLVRDLVGAGIDILEVRAERATLEEFFLEATDDGEADLGR